MCKKQLFFIFFVSFILISVQHVPSDEEEKMCCIQLPSGKKVSPFEVMLPSGLVLKPSELSKAHLKQMQDHDFHIDMHESDTALIWAAQDQECNSDYLCGALVPLDQEMHPQKSIYEKLISVLSSPYKMISDWVWKGDSDLISSAKTSDLHWEKVAETSPGEKWYVCGVQKKQDVPVKYYIRRKNQKVWVTKQEAFELALSGQLEVVIPPLNE